MSPKGAQAAARVAEGDALAGVRSKANYDIISHINDERS